MGLGGGALEGGVGVALGVVVPGGLVGEFPIVGFVGVVPGPERVVDGFEDGFDELGGVWDGAV